MVKLVKFVAYSRPVKSDPAACSCVNFANVRRVMRSVEFMSSSKRTLAAKDLSGIDTSGEHEQLTDTSNITMRR